MKRQDVNIASLGGPDVKIHVPNIESIRLFTAKTESRGGRGTNYHPPFLTSKLEAPTDSL